MSDEVPTLDILLRKLKFTTDPEEREKLKKKIVLQRIRDKDWSKKRYDDK